MKKLLTILLVLALAPMAFGNATLSSGGKTTLVLGTDVDVDDVITVDLTFDCELTGISYIDFLPSAPNVGDIQPIVAVGAWEPCFNTLPSAGTLSGGDILDAEAFMTAGWSLGTGSLGVATGTVLYSFSATVKGTGQIDAYLAATDTIFDLNNTTGMTVGSNFVGLEIVPEPMTIALLGLGGLFLMRRRK